MRIDRMLLTMAALGGIAIAGCGGGGGGGGDDTPPPARKAVPYFSRVTFNGTEVAVGTANLYGVELMNETGERWDALSLRISLATPTATRVVKALDWGDLLPGASELSGSFAFDDPEGTLGDHATLRFELVRLGQVLDARELAVTVLRYEQAPGAPHTLGVPPAPHAPAEQAPQSTVRVTQHESAAGT